MDSEYEERLRTLETQVAGISKVLTGNGDPESGVTSIVRLVRQRVHDTANGLLALENTVQLAVRDRDHALELLRAEVRRHEEDFVTATDAKEMILSAAKQAVKEHEENETKKVGSRDKRLNMWLVFAGVVVSSTIGPTIIAIIVAATK